MRKLFILLVVLASCGVLRAQVTLGAVQGHCYQGGVPAQVQGIGSTNRLLGVIPSCTVTVYYTGTTNPIPGNMIYANAEGSASLGNPFTANAQSSTDPGGYLFWASTSQGVDICFSGGVSPNTYSTSVCQTGVFPAGGVNPASGVTSVSATSPIEVNGGTGPSEGAVTVSCPTCGSSTVNWPASGDAVISTASDTPSGVAPVAGECMVASASGWGTGQCDLTQILPSPTFSPTSPYTGNVVELTITDSIPQASIYWCAFTSSPCTPSTLYTAPISITGPGTSNIEAIATEPAYAPSAAAYWYGTIIPPLVAPILSPLSGTYAGSVSVTVMSVGAGQSLYYTLDGTTPTCSSTPYTGPITITTTTTVEAIACEPPESPSSVTTETYTIVAPGNTVPTPVISPASGSGFSLPVSVTITDSLGTASIYYGISTPPNYGSISCATGTPYTGAFYAPGGLTNVLAIACESGYADSAIATASYTGTVNPPSFSPPSPYTGPATNLTLSAGGGTTIKYCTGSLPVPGISCIPDTTYTGAIDFTASEYVNAQAESGTSPGSLLSSTVQWIGTLLNTSSVEVNDNAVTSPNFNGATPAAGTGYTNVTFQVSGSSVSAEVPALSTLYPGVISNGTGGIEQSGGGGSYPWIISPTGSTQGNSQLTVDQIILSGNPAEDSITTAGAGEILINGVGLTIIQGGGSSDIELADSAIDIQETATGSINIGSKEESGSPVNVNIVTDSILNASDAYTEEVPVSSGCTTSTNGQLCYDSSGHEWHFWVNGADVATQFSESSGGDTITSPNSTLTVGGTATATTLDINLGNANTWTAVQTFGTDISIGGQTLSGGVQGGGDTKALLAGTVSGISALLCTDSNGGATTSSCPAANGLSGMTASQVPIAATSSTVTSSEAINGTDTSIQSGTGTFTASNIAIGDSNGGVTPALALPNGIMATTQTTGDDSTKVATDAFVLANATGSGTVDLGTTGQIAQYPSSGTAVEGETVSGDCTLASGGAITCTKTNGSSFTTFATIEAGTLTNGDTCTYSSSGPTISCNTAGGTGTVTTTGSPSSSQIAAFSGSTSITAATQANLGSLIDLAEYDVIYSGGTSAALQGTSFNGFQYDSTSGAPVAATQANLGSLINLTTNSVLYSGGPTSAVTGTTPVDSAVLVTNASGVPSESTTLPSGLTIPGYAAALTNDTVETTSFTAACNGVYELNGSSGITITSPSITTGCVVTVGNKNSGTGTWTPGSSIIYDLESSTPGSLTSTATIAENQTRTFTTDGTYWYAHASAPGPMLLSGGTFTNGDSCTWSNTTGFSCNSTPSTGTVTTTGSPSSGQLAAFSGATSITSATAANVGSIIDLAEYDLIASGGTSAAPVGIVPSSTSGVPLVSQGSSAQAAFGTAVVAGGGTGDTTLTAYAPLFGGTTSTGAVQSGTAGTAGQVLTSGGSSAKGSYIDFPQVYDVPSANCVSSTAGSAWSTTITPACRAGTNNLGGNLPFADASTAQFEVEIPEDWDTSTDPYVALYFTTGSNTSGTIIFEVAVSCYSSSNAETDDQSFETAQTFSTVTAADANYGNKESLQLNSTSMTGCSAGGSMILKFTRNTDTATGTVPVTKAVVTIPRQIVVQAN